MVKRLGNGISMDPMLHHVAQEVAAGELLESCPAVLMDWGYGGPPGYWKAYGC